MITINLYKAILSKSRFDVDIQDIDTYRYKICDLLHLVLNNNESCLKYNNKMYLLHLVMPSTSYVYYDIYANGGYAKTKRIPKRLK